MSGDFTGCTEQVTLRLKCHKQAAKSAAKNKQVAVDSAHDKSIARTFFDELKRSAFFSNSSWLGAARQAAKYRIQLVRRTGSVQRARLIPHINVPLCKRTCE
jgi:hypothetical protein